MPNHPVRSGKSGTRPENGSLRYFVQRWYAYSLGIFFWFESFIIFFEKKKIKIDTIPHYRKWDEIQTLHGSTKTLDYCTFAKHFGQIQIINRKTK